AFGPSSFSLAMPPRRRPTATAEGAAFLQALNHESPRSDAVIMLDWIRQYAYSQNEQFFDRRCNTILEAAERLQRDSDRRDRERRRELRNQEQAERERLRGERDPAPSEDDSPPPPSHDHPSPPPVPIVLIVTSPRPTVGNGAVEGVQDHRPSSRDPPEAPSQPRSRSHSQSRSPNSPSATAPQNQNPHPSNLNAITESEPQGEQDGDGILHPSLPSPPPITGSHLPLPTIEDISDDTNDYHTPSHEPSYSPEPQNSGRRPSPSHPEDEPREEGGERQSGVGAGVVGGVGAAENAAIRNNTVGNGSVDNAVGTQVPGERGGATQPDNNDPTNENPPPLNAEHNIIGPQTPLRLSAWTDEPHYRSTLNEILQLPEIQSEGGLSNNTVKLLLELVASWFDISPYKALGESMAYIIDRTSTSNIPQDFHHEPTSGHSLSGKRFDGDPPESLGRLRDRWNNTRSTCCLGNKFWQSIKFKLSAMELYVHWDYLQMVYKSEKPEFATDQAYIQRLVKNALGNQHPSGRKTVDMLKRAVAPYLGIGPDDGDNKLWTYAIKLGSRVVVFKEHWGLVALARTGRLIKIPASLLARTIPLFLKRHPSVRDISLVIFYDYVQPLWSEGSLNIRCRQFATSISERVSHVEKACRENPMGLIGLFGYREASGVLVPEMTGALPSTPPPQEGPMTPPPTRRERVSDDGDAVFDAEEPDEDRGDRSDDAAASSSEADSSSEPESQDSIVRSARASSRNSPIRPRLQRGGGSPTPSTMSRASRVKRQRRG
ncbi:MAG: hypothetical protein Q9188_007619, partial [Gyalolechia gomerana]